jgi:tetratricopeptide (TPR) repeat protein
LLRDDVLAVRVEATRVLMPLMQGLEPRQQQVLDAAMDEYLTVVSLNSDRAEGQTNMAMVYLAKGDIVAAQEALQEALLLNPQWVPAMVNLADLYRASGRDHLGGALLENAVRLVPENSDALLARALWLVRQNQTDQALPLLKAAWELSEQSRFAYVYAVALNGVGDPQAALAVLDSALARRADRQLLETALSIARDAGLLVKAARYAAQIEGV